MWAFQGLHEENLPPVGIEMGTSTIPSDILPSELSLCSHALMVLAKLSKSKSQLVHQQKSS